MPCQSDLIRTALSSRAFWYASAALATALLLWASPGVAGTTSSDGGDNGEGSTPFTGLANAPSANLLNGTMAMSVPIIIPPGRPLATPSLALSYSSGAASSTFGHGWSLPLGSIERSSKRGVPRCVGDHTTNEFVLNLGGSTTELVYVGNETYRARIDEGYLEAVVDTAGNSWTVYDRRGLRNRFGSDPAARSFQGADQFMDVPGCSFTSAWALTEVMDPHGNTIEISYTSVDGVSYPDSISYGGNPGEGLEHPFEISFGLVDIVAAGGAPKRTLRLGVDQTISKLVDTIEVRAKAQVGGAFATVRTYDLEYEFVPGSGHALLETVTGDGIPDQTFEYHVPPLSVGDPVTGSFGAPSLRHRSAGGSLHYTIMDMNGDALVDVIGGVGTWLATLGTTSGIASGPDVPWTGLSAGSIRTANTFGDQHSLVQDLIDLNGDGFPDRIDTLADGFNSKWRVALGYCNTASDCGFESPVLWKAPGDDVISLDWDEQPDGDPTTPENFVQYTMRGLLDLNGDGLPDLIETNQPAGGDLSTLYQWDVYWNKGDDFETQADPGFVGFGPLSVAGVLDNSGYTAPGSTQQLLTFVDFNGDGLPDRVSTSSLAQEVGGGSLGALLDANGDVVLMFAPDDVPWCPAFPNICPGWIPPGGSVSNEWIAVELNTGSGFAPPVYSAVSAEVKSLRQTVIFSGPQYSSQVFTAFFDFNNDGLPDIVARDNVLGTLEYRVSLNRGDGRLEGVTLHPDPQSALPLPILGSKIVSDLPYPQRRDDGLGAWVGFLHRGYSAAGTRTTRDVVDWNGDGLLDFVDIDTSTQQYTVRSLGVPAGSTGPAHAPLVMTKAHNGLGGETEVRYVSSSEFSHGGDDGSPDLPFSSWVVGAIRKSDGLCDASAAVDPFDSSSNACIGAGNEIVTFYEFADGMFDTDEREFRGFGMVKEIDVDGNHVETLFSQDDITRGKIVERSVYVAGFADPLQRETFAWQSQASPLDSARTQVFLAEKKTEGLAIVPSRDASLDQCFLERNEPPDAWGRVTTRCSLSCSGAPATPASCANPTIGQVTTSTDWADPAPGSGSHVREKPWRISVEYVDPNGSTALLSDKTLRYDDQSGGGLAAGTVDRGNLHTVESYLDASWSDPAVPPAAPTVTTWHDAFGNVTSVEDAEGNTRTSTFDPSFFALYPTLESLPNPNATHVKAIETDLRYGKATKVTDENGQASEWVFDSLGRVVCEALPGDSTASCLQGGSFSPTTQYQYIHGTPGAASVPERLSRVVVMRSEVNHPNGFAVSKAYTDALGRKRYAEVEQVVSGVLQMVVREHAEFDSNGRVSTQFPPYIGPYTASPPVAGTTFDYRLNGHATAKDPMGRAHRRTPPDGSFVDSFFEGIRTRTVNARGGETVVLQDQLGNAVQKESRLSSGSVELKFTYVVDGMGRVLETTLDDDPATTVVETYDTLGRLLARDDPDSGLWRYGYDRNGNRVYLDDPKSNQHVQSCYDALDRVEMRCTYAASDDYDPLACSTQCAGGIAESIYTYDDGLGGQSLGVGRLSSVLDQTGSTTFYYDERGRISKSTQNVLGVNATFESTFDASGHLDTLLYPDGELVDYGYDAVGLPKAMSSGSGADLVEYVKDIAYDAFGRPTRVHRGNGTEDLLDYHGQSLNYRLKSIRSRATNGSADFLDLEYGYNDLGKIDQITDFRDPTGGLSNGFQHSFDDLGRLIGSDWTAGTTHDDAFDYDSVGNLSLKGGASLTYGDPAHPHQVTQYGPWSIAHNDNGERFSKSDGTTSSTLTYDPLGQLTLVQGQSGSGSYSTTYGYDFNGARVWKAVDGADLRHYFGRFAEYQNGELTKYYYVDDLLIANKVNEAPTLSGLLAGGSLNRRFEWEVPKEVVFGTSVLVLLLLVSPGASLFRRRGLIAVPRALGGVLLVVAGSVPPMILLPTKAIAGGGGGEPMQVVRHFHRNHLGSVEAITSINSTLLQQVRYAPHGQVRGRFDPNGAPVSGDEAFRIEFGGYETQHESGLQYAGARFYDPELGQFLTLDPEAQLASPYAYATDPINAVDPDGRSFVAAIVGLVKAILTIAAYASVALAIVNAALTGAQGGNFGLAMGQLALSFALSYAAPGALSFVADTLHFGQAAAGSLQTGYFAAGVGLSAAGAVMSAQQGNVLGAVTGALGAFVGAVGIVGRVGGATGSASEAVSGQVESPSVAGIDQASGSGTTSSAVPDFATDPDVVSELNRAWTESNPHAPDVPRGSPGSLKREQGGWVRINRITGNRHVIRVPAGTRDSLATISGTKPGWSLFYRNEGWFHTHPNTAAEGYTHVPSPGDIGFTRNYAQVPGVIMTHKGIEVIPYP